MSFFLIRLLQNFSHMELDLAARPLNARPPAEWTSVEGHQGREKIVPKTHLTMYVHVSISPVVSTGTPRLYADCGGCRADCG